MGSRGGVSLPSMTARLRNPGLLKSAVGHTACLLVAWAMVMPLSARASEQSYRVKRGDTVYGIAKSYGVPQDDLVERNGLSRNCHIYPGQRLIIPSRGSTPQHTGRPALPGSIQRAIDKAPVKPGRWKYIVIHHSGVDTGTMKSMDRYHREVRHMENGLAYHFVIGNGSGMGDGEIGVGHRWTKQLDGGHLASEAQDKVAIGICLVGNFDNHPPTRKEMESLRALVEALMARCHLTPKAVKTHQQINIVHTRCPGAEFPTKSFLESLRSP
jgi:LysM repeat protein